MSPGRQIGSLCNDHLARLYVSLLSTISAYCLILEMFCLTYSTQFCSSFYEKIKSVPIYSVMTGTRGLTIETCNKHKLDLIYFLINISLDTRYT